MIHRSLESRDACLDPETLAAYADGLLVNGAVADVDRHIDHCADCRGELSALASVLDGALGRYAVLRTIGRGSMGIVLRAFDRELERAVALKILATAHGDDDIERSRREAQRMARLAHPNVVRVYDVTTHDGAIVIAMELIEGTTLRSRIAMETGTSHEPRWRRMLDVCIEAGRGLAAAHDASLVHRDFKPENVLCADDGRVLVSDFGLARMQGELDERPVRVGTLPYMAPEVIAGDAATTASDQYSFCVTAFEALCGARPPSSSSALPEAVRSILARGLAVNPAMRFASMTALLEALLASARRRWPRGSRITTDTSWKNRPRAMRQPRRFRH